MQSNSTTCLCEEVNSTELPLKLVFPEEEKHTSLCHKDNIQCYKSFCGEI
jgi:hypothetical protein